MVIHINRVHTERRNGFLRIHESAQYMVGGAEDWTTHGAGEYYAVADLSFFSTAVHTNITLATATQTHIDILPTSLFTPQTNLNTYTLSLSIHCIFNIHHPTVSTSEYLHNTHANLPTSLHA